MGIFFEDIRRFDVDEKDNTKPQNLFFTNHNKKTLDQQTRSIKTEFKLNPNH